MSLETKQWLPRFLPVSPGTSNLSVGHISLQGELGDTVSFPGSSMSSSGRTLFLRQKGELTVGGHLAMSITEGLAFLFLYKGLGQVSYFFFAYG